MSAKKERSILDLVVDGSVVSAAVDLNEIKHELKETRKREELAQWQRNKEAEDRKEAEKDAEVQRQREHAERQAIEQQRLEVAEREQAEQDRKRKIHEIELIQQRGLGIRHELFLEVEELALAREITLEKAAESLRADLISRRLGFMLTPEFCPADQTESATVQAHPTFDWKRCPLSQVGKKAIRAAMSLSEAMELLGRKMKAEDQEFENRKAEEVEEARQIAKAQAECEKYLGEVKTVEGQFDRIALDVTADDLRQKRKIISRPTKVFIWAVATLLVASALIPVWESVLKFSDGVLDVVPLSIAGILVAMAMNRTNRNEKAHRPKWFPSSSSGPLRVSVDLRSIDTNFFRVDGRHHKSLGALLLSSSDEGFAFLVRILRAHEHEPVLKLASQLPRERAIYLFTKARIDNRNPYLDAARKHGLVFMAIAVQNKFEPEQMSYLDKIYHDLSFWFLRASGLSLAACPWATSDGSEDSDVA